MGLIKKDTPTYVMRLSASLFDQTVKIHLIRNVLVGISTNRGIRGRCYGMSHPITAPTIC